MWEDESSGFNVEEKKIFADVARKYKNKPSGKGSGVWKWKKEFMIVCLCFVRVTSIVCEIHSLVLSMVSSMEPNGCGYRKGCALLSVLEMRFCPVWVPGKFKWKYELWCEFFQ